MPRSKPHTEETKRKIGDANRGVWIDYRCDYCNKECSEKQSHYRRKKKHFCSNKCYAKYRKYIMLPHEQNTWKGGISPYESHRKWVKKNPKRMAHLKARRYARKKNAEGTHTLEEWQSLCREHGDKCAHCNQEKKLTKDHIKPLSLGGTDYISNIQPLCRSCNSRKWKKF